MGDRSNAIIIDETGEKGIGIYTHWYGSTLPSLIATALNKAKPRWNDSYYATRMIFDNLLTQVKAHDEETGWGLYCYTNNGDICEEENETVFVDFSTKKVKLGNKDFSFNDFCRMFK